MPQPFACKGEMPAALFLRETMFPSENSIVPRQARPIPLIVPAPIAPEAPAALTRTHVAVLLSLAAGIGVILWGVTKYKWYVTEIGAILEQKMSLEKANRTTIVRVFSLVVEKMQNIIHYSDERACAGRFGCAARQSADDGQHRPAALQGLS